MKQMPQAELALRLLAEKRGRKSGCDSEQKELRLRWPTKKLLTWPNVAGGLGSTNRPFSCLIPEWMSQSAVVRDYRALEVGRRRANRLVLSVRGDGDLDALVLAAETRYSSADLSDPEPGGLTHEDHAHSATAAGSVRGQQRPCEATRSRDFRRRDGPALSERLRCAGIENLEPSPVDARRTVVRRSRRCHSDRYLAFSYHDHHGRRACRAWHPGQHAARKGRRRSLLFSRFLEGSVAAGCGSQGGIEDRLHPLAGHGRRGERLQPSRILREGGCRCEPPRRLEQGQSAGPRVPNQWHVSLVSPGMDERPNTRAGSPIPAQDGASGLVAAAPCRARQRGTCQRALHAGGARGPGVYG